MRLDINFEALASSEAAGCATPEQLASLRAAPGVWAQTLRRLLAETEAALASARRITGPERGQVLADLSGERDRLRAALARLEADRSPAPRKRPERRPAGERGATGPATTGPFVSFTPPALQASWQAGRVVLWAGRRMGRRPGAGSRRRRRPPPPRPGRLRR